MGNSMETFAMNILPIARNQIWIQQLGQI